MAVSEPASTFLKNCACCSGDARLLPTHEASTSDLPGSLPLRGLQCGCPGQNSAAAPAPGGSGAGPPLELPSAPHSWALLFLVQSYGVRTTPFGLSLISSSKDMLQAWAHGAKGSAHPLEGPWFGATSSGCLCSPGRALRPRQGWLLHCGLQSVCVCWGGGGAERGQVGEGKGG